MRRTTFLCSFLSLSVFAAAQTPLFLPKEYERAWGRGSTTLLGSNRSRTQLVYGAQLATGTIISGIRFRPTASIVDRAAFTADLEIRCSSGPNAPGSLSPTFANNVGSDELVVLPQQTVNIPAMPANRGTGAMAEILFTTPFVFGLNNNPNLVVEVRVFGRSAGASWSTDRAFASANGRATTAGLGCGAATINSSSTGGVFVGGCTVNIALANAPANTIALLAPSFDQKEFALGIALPFGLSQLGTAPGCALLVDPSLGLLPFAADGAGAATASIPIPVAFGRTGLGFQWLYLVPASAANPLGLESTASRAVWIGPEVCAPSFQYVWDLTSATIATGNATTDAIPVAELLIQ